MAVGGGVGVAVGTWVMATVVGTSVGSGSEDRHATAATANPDITQTAIADDRYVLELRKGRRRLMCMNRRRLSEGIGCSYGLRVLGFAGTPINYLKSAMRNSIVWCAFSRHSRRGNSTVD